MLPTSDSVASELLRSPRVRPPVHPHEERALAANTSCVNWEFRDVMERAHARYPMIEHWRSQSVEPSWEIIHAARRRARSDCAGSYHRRTPPTPPRSGALRSRPGDTFTYSRLDANKTARVPAVRSNSLAPQPRHARCDGRDQDRLPLVESFVRSPLVFATSTRQISRRWTRTPTVVELELLTGVRQVGESRWSAPLRDDCLP
ncbi:hypothetical protein BH11MYX2_BH11MYX2_37420 [soil metagenome]